MFRRQHTLLAFEGGQQGVQVDLGVDGQVEQLLGIEAEVIFFRLVGLGRGLQLKRTVEFLVSKRTT